MREASEHFLKYKTSPNRLVSLQKQQLPEAVNILSLCTVTGELWQDRLDLQISVPAQVSPNTENFGWNWGHIWRI